MLGSLYFHDEMKGKILYIERREMSKEFKKHDKILELLLWIVQKEPASEVERNC